MSSLSQRLQSILIDHTETAPYIYSCSTCGASVEGYGNIIPHTEDCRAGRVLRVGEDVGKQIDGLIGINEELHRRLGDYPEDDVDDDLR